MEEYFIDYLFDALDDRTRREVEAYLEHNPEVREKFALLKQASETLAADVEPIAPPSQLVERTLARVAEHICTSDAPATELPQAPPVSRTSLPTGRSWWRRADVLVAACLLVTTVGIGLMLLGRPRGPSSSALIADCKNNLRQYHFALQTYRTQHGKLPDVAKEEPRDVAGMVVPILKDAGVLPSSVSIRCPGIGAPLSSQLSLTALCDDRRRFRAAFALSVDVLRLFARLPR